MPFQRPMFENVALALTEHGPLPRAAVVLAVLQWFSEKDPREAHTKAGAERMVDEAIARGLLAAQGDLLGPGPSYQAQMRARETAALHRVVPLGAEPHESPVDAWPEANWRLAQKHLAQNLAYSGPERRQDLVARIVAGGNLFSPADLERLIDEACAGGWAEHDGELLRAGPEWDAWLFEVQVLRSDCPDAPWWKTHTPAKPQKLKKRKR